MKLLETIKSYKFKNTREFEREKKRLEDKDYKLITEEFDGILKPYVDEELGFIIAFFIKSDYM